MKKEYTNGEITVVWQPDFCIHCAECANGLYQVFKPREKPWIQMGDISSKEIVAQVKQCPSGALSIKD
ncbi:MAG: (4Fe-4S)-binding protein [Flavobacteriales bacterium]|nr:(4Fe-4S)-binding protein [Flavobacteriales bacterium]